MIWQSAYPDIHPQILRFTGEDLCLNSEQQIWLRVDEHPEILAYRDEEIIFSDGTSVLGADNKAAVTVVMTLLENMTAEHKHGDIVVAFVPVGNCRRAPLLASKKGINKNDQRE